MAENRVNFGLKNVHYSIVTYPAGVATYAVPVRLPGAVEMTVEPKGERADFYADDILYYTTSSNQGYEATLTIANITEEFRTDVMGEILEATDNVLTENADAKPREIALLFEFDGDTKAVRHLLYHCSVSRPSLNSATKTETTEPQTMELNMTAAPRPTDGMVKRSTTDLTPALVYDAWYTTVYNV
jgi:phi13 family phage major tail protein